jgi:hypothetical protein
MTIQLKNIEETLNRLRECFSTEYGDKTLHETLEDIKVENYEINKTLKRIATALEKQLENQLKLNDKLLKNLYEEKN